VTLALLYLVDLVGKQAVSLLVDPSSRLSARCLYETEHGSLVFIDPVASVVDPVLALDLEVLGMRLRYSGRGHSFHVPVLVEVQGHESLDVNPDLTLRLVRPWQPPGRSGPLTPLPDCSAGRPRGSNAPLSATAADGRQR